MSFGICSKILNWRNTQNRPNITKMSYNSEILSFIVSSSKLEWNLRNTNSRYFLRHCKVRYIRSRKELVPYENNLFPMIGNKLFFSEKSFSKTEKKNNLVYVNTTPSVKNLLPKCDPTTLLNVSEGLWCRSEFLMHFWLFTLNSIKDYYIKVLFLLKINYYYYFSNRFESF